MRIRSAFTGMLPGAIVKFEELLEAVAALDPKVIKGYNAGAGKDDYAYWGAACRIQCAGMEQLRIEAEAREIIWLSDDGDIAYTNGLTIEDFQTYRVNEALELTPEREV